MFLLTNGINWTSWHVCGHFGQHKGMFDMDFLAPSLYMRHCETHCAMCVCSVDPAIPAINVLSLCRASLSCSARLSVIKEQAAPWCKNIVARGKLPSGTVTFAWHGINNTYFLFLGFWIWVTVLTVSVVDSSEGLLLLIWSNGLTALPAWLRGTALVYHVSYF